MDVFYCADLVRRLDRDRYLCSLFAPEEAREDLFALYAFNLEVARIPDAVSEPILGAVRLQWWRETLNAIYTGTTPAHEVAHALARTIASHELNRMHFDGLIEARELDLDMRAPADMQTLIAYADATAGGLTLLALEILNPGGNGLDRAEAVGRNIGIAWALIGLLRSIEFRAQRGRINLPRALLEKHEVNPADILALRCSPGIRSAVEEIAEQARSYLAAARTQTVADWASPALLPGVLASSYLSRIERADFDPFNLRSDGGGFRRQLRLWVAATRGRF